MSTQTMNFVMFCTIHISALKKLQALRKMFDIQPQKEEVFSTYFDHNIYEEAPLLKRGKGVVLFDGTHSFAVVDQNANVARYIPSNETKNFNKIRVGEELKSNGSEEEYVTVDGRAVPSLFVELNRLSLRAYDEKRISADTHHVNLELACRVGRFEPRTHEG